jgi:orotidine-5'-phosphate decarboxylase
LILAVDCASAKEARQLIGELRDYVGLFKVGLELFSRTGPALLEELHREGVPVFFDGKFMDIPNTVARATEAITSVGVSMFNVHASGGSRMMQAAVEASSKTCAEKGLAKPISLAVTVLTSLGDADLNAELGIPATVEQQVCRLALLARNAGMDGVVASAGEVARLREVCGADFVLVTPGLRPAWASKDDQVRVVTPADAMRFGSDYVVIGRPITAAADRRDAAQRVLEEMQAALS